MGDHLTSSGNNEKTFPYHKRRRHNHSKIQKLIINLPLIHSTDIAESFGHIKVMKGLFNEAHDHFNLKKNNCYLMKN